MTKNKEIFLLFYKVESWFFCRDTEVEEVVAGIEN